MRKVRTARARSLDNALATIREAVKRLGRADLIGPVQHHLVPARQPAGTGLGRGEGRRFGRKHGARRFLTKGVRIPPVKAR